MDPEKAFHLRQMLAKHHSTGDWDYSSVDWQLNTSIYVSSPSSLEWLDVTEVFVKTSVVPIANVKEGRVVTQIRISTNTAWSYYLRIIFRYQDADNYYFVIFDRYDYQYANLYIKRRYGGVETTLASRIAYILSATWKNIRVTWWNDYVGLAIRVEYWNGSAWVLWKDAYDASNYWKDVGGRVGFYGNPDYAHGVRMFVDDTYIYGIG